MKRVTMMFTLAVAAIAATCAPAASQSRIQAGILECRGAGSASFVVGSVHQLQCWFRSDRGARYPYYGAVVVGGNANALVGGSENSFALQPLSFEGQTGLNVAVGVASLELRPAGPVRHLGRRAAPHYHHRKHAHG